MVDLLPWGHLPGSFGHLLTLFLLELFYLEFEWPGEIWSNNGVGVTVPFTMELVTEASPGAHLHRTA